VRTFRGSCDLFSAPSNLHTTPTIVHYPQTPPRVSLQASRANLHPQSRILRFCGPSFFSFAGFALFSHFHRRLVECQSRIIPISHRFAASSSPAVSQILQRSNPLPVTPDRIPHLPPFLPRNPTLPISCLYRQGHNDSSRIQHGFGAGPQQNPSNRTTRPAPNTDTQSSCRDTLELVSSATISKPRVNTNIANQPPQRSQDHGTEYCQCISRDGL
jgi:hypothetical protein